MFFFLISYLYIAKSKEEITELIEFVYILIICVIMSLNCQVRQTQGQKFGIAVQLQPRFPQCKRKKTINHYLQGTNKLHICHHNKKSDKFILI